MEPAEESERPRRRRRAPSRLVGASPRTGVREPVEAAAAPARAPDAPEAGELPVIGYVCRAEGHFDTLWIAPEVERVTGFSPADFLHDGLFWIDRVHPADRPAVLAGFAELHERGRIRYEYRWKARDGWLRVVDVVTLLPARQGRAARIVGAMVPLGRGESSPGRRLRLRARRLASRLVDQRESHLEDLARTLHDGTAQTLAALHLELEAARALLETAGAARAVAPLAPPTGAPPSPAPGDAPPDALARGTAHLQRAGHLLEHAVAGLRDVSARLRPSALADVGLLATLEGELRRAARAGVRTRLSIRPGLRRVDERRAVLVFRLLQELLDDGSAQRLLVQLASQGDVLLLRVRVGTAHGRLSEPSRALRERIRAAGGRLLLRAVPHAQGSELVARVRLPARA